VQVLFILLPLALLVAGVMLGLFVWAAKSGQFDDMETPPVRMLLDEQVLAPEPSPGGSLDPGGPGGPAS
jgi:cbb3-type cytochrome oxidase maturation protein